MTLAELLILAVGLSMDAFAVAVCKGLSAPRLKPSNMAVTGLWFGGFQGLMPLIGYLLGSSFEKYISGFDHWIAFILLALIGANMIKESTCKDDEPSDASFAPKVMFVMAVATSIDALAVGITFAVLPDVNIWWAIFFIGVITFMLSSLGVFVGHKFGEKYKSKAEFTGGAILILMGIKILLEHLEIVKF